MPLEYLTGDPSSLLNVSASAFGFTKPSDVKAGTSKRRPAITASRSLRTAVTSLR